MPQVYGDEQPTISQGEYDTGMTTKESDSNIDPSHADYVQSPDQGGHKKSSLFGKLKEKTKKAGDKIKSKVGKKKSDGTGTPGQDDDDDEEDDTDDYSPGATPASSGNQYRAPESTPRAFGTFENPTPVSQQPTSEGDSDYSQGYQPSSTTGASQDMASGGLFDSNSRKVDESSAKIPGYESIMKPKGFDTTTDSEPSSYNPSYTSGVSQDIAAGGLMDSNSRMVDESDAKIPEGIMKPKDFDTTESVDPQTPEQSVEPIVPYTEKELNEPSSTPTYGASEKVDDLQSSVPDNLTNPFSSESTEESRGYTAPETSNDVTSVPRDDESYETPSSEAKDFSTSQEDSMTAPSYTEKATQGVNVAKDTLLGGAAAAAGALGYNAYNKDKEDNKSAGEYAGDYASGAQDKAQEVRDRSYDTAADAKDTVADKANEGPRKTENLFSSGSDSSSPNMPGSATEAAYQTKDAAQSKAADLNNATNDSETYTEKAANTATAAKDKVADTLGFNQPSTGPSVLDKAKEYWGSAVGATTGTAQSAVDTTKDKAYQAKDAAADTTGSATDTSKDYTGSAFDTTNDYSNSAKDNVGSAADTTKDYATSAKDTAADKTGSAVDTAKDYATSAKDTTADNTSSAADTAKDYAYSAKDTTADNAGSAVDTAKGYTGAAVDTTKDYAGKAYDTSAQYAQSATDTTKDYTQRAVDTTKDYTQSAVDTTKNYGQQAMDTTKDYTTKAKDTTVDTVTPKDHDKALSEHVTETLNNLPAQLKETVSSYTQSVNSPTAHDDTAPKEGLMGKLTGLFGFGQPKQAGHTSTDVAHDTVPHTTTTE